MDDRVERTVEVPVEPERAWEVATDDDAIAEWMGGPVRLDPRPGGTVEFDDPRGVTRWGVVEEVEPARLLRFRWHDRDGDRPESTVEIHLEPTEGGTRVKVIETLPRGWPTTAAGSTASVSVRWERMIGAPRLAA
jgi:uncharacterized protein YndB with AHSA1/START domain